MEVRKRCIANIGTDIFFPGGPKNIIAIANGGCKWHRVERGLAEGSKVIFFYTFNYCCYLISIKSLEMIFI